MDYRVDIILCVDVCSSMKEIVGDIKKMFAESFWKDFTEALAACSKNVSVVRIKVITFGTTSDELKTTRWFNISDQAGLEPENFKAGLRRISCSSSTGKTTALGALDLAFHQDWTQEGDRRRHVICLLTNNTAERLDSLKLMIPMNQLIESNNLEELGGLWQALNVDQAMRAINLLQPAKRLVVFAPQAYPWPEIYEAWDQTIYNPMDNSGFICVYDDIIRSIVSSV